MVKLQLDGDVLRGAVIDDGGGSEHQVRARGPRDLSGRGLAIVEALTSRSGIREGTTHVWSKMPIVAAVPG